MKSLGFLSVALAAAALSLSSPGLALADYDCPHFSTQESRGQLPPGGYRGLDANEMSCRAAARPIRRFIARQPAIDTAQALLCRRRTVRRVDCTTTATGETTAKAATCHLRVAVRTVDRRPRARLASPRCRSRPPAGLTRLAAEDAMYKQAGEVTPWAVAIVELERIDHWTFLGVVQWLKWKPLGPGDICDATIEVRLHPPEMNASTLGSTC